MRADQAVSCERGQGGPELPPENAGREKPSFSGRQGANIGWSCTGHTARSTLALQRLRTQKSGFAQGGL